MNFPPPSETQARFIWRALTGLSIGVLLGLIGLAGWGLARIINVLSPVLWPLAIGGMLAYLLDPLVDFFERLKVPRRNAVILVFAIGMLAVAGFLGSVVPRLVRETGRLINAVPQYSQTLQQDLNRWMTGRPFFEQWRVKLFPRSITERAKPQERAAAPPPARGATNQAAAAPPVANESDWAGKASERVIEWLSEAMPQVGRWALAQLGRVASIAGTLVGLALVPVFTYYFLSEKKAIVESWTKYLPVRESRFKEELVFIIQAINNYLIAFFRGQVVVALCIGTLLTLGFLLVGLNYALLLGLLAGVLNIVPYLGAILTLVPAVTLAAVEFRDWLHPVLVAGIFALVQTLEGFVISPRIMGDRVGLHPLTIMVALMVGTTLLGGILGGILAIPLTAALRVLMFRYVWKGRGEQG